MRSILVTYPDFQALPRGLKRMLVTSESLFFGEAKGAGPASCCCPTGREQTLARLGSRHWRRDSFQARHSLGGNASSSIQSLSE